MEIDSRFEDHVLLVVNLNSICRFCLRSDGAMTAIFDEESDSQLTSQLSSFITINLNPDDNLPSKICHRCRYMIEMCSSFKTMLLKSHKTLYDSFNNDNYELKRPPSSENEKDVTLAKGKLFYKSFLLKGENPQEPQNSLDPSEYLLENIVDVGNSSNNKCKETYLVGVDNVKLSKRRKSLKNENVKNSLKIEESLTSHNKKRQCLLCLENCKDEEELKEHIDKHVEGTDLQPYYLLGERNIMCNVCQKSFDYRYNFLKHQREHLSLKPFHCSFAGCKYKFHSKAALRHHSDIHADRNYICSVCAVGFKRRSDLKGHEIIHEDAGSNYECPVCQFKCKNRLTRASHMKKHQKIRMFKCASCPKEFFSASELRRHEYIHMPEKRFRCDQCTYAYYSQSALTRHLKLHHSIDSTITNDQLRKCSLCWQMHVHIPAKICLNHLKEPLSKEFPFRCENCGNGYFEDVCFKKHIELCSNEMPTQIVEDCANKNVTNVDEKLSFIHYRDELMQYSNTDPPQLNE